MGGAVYAVTSGKGGVGKTTTAVSLAVALRQRGRSVAVLDADLGMPNVASTLDVEPETTVHDLLAADGPDDDAGVAADATGTTPAATTDVPAPDVGDAVLEIADGFGVLAGDTTLDGYAAVEPEGLEAVVDALADAYGCVLLDTGGGLSYEGVLPLELCDEVLLVTSPDPAAVCDTAKSKELAGRLGAPVRGVVVTRATDGDDPDEIAGRLGVNPLGTVPFDPVVAESAASGEPIAAYAPESAAAEAYGRIAERLSEDLRGSPDPFRDALAADDAGAVSQEANGQEGGEVENGGAEGDESDGTVSEERGEVDAKESGEERGGPAPPTDEAAPSDGEAAEPAPVELAGAEGASDGGPSAAGVEFAALADVDETAPGDGSDDAASDGGVLSRLSGLLR